MKKKYTVNEGTFAEGTYNQYNGATVTEELDKDGNSVIGTSGDTKGYATASGGRLYLSDSQVTPA